MFEFCQKNDSFNIRFNIALPKVQFKILKILKMVPITCVIVDNHGPCGMFLLTKSVHKITFLVVHKPCDQQARTT